MPRAAHSHTYRRQLRHTRLFASCLISLIVMIAGAARAYAETAPSRPVRHGHRAWTTSDGLPQNAVSVVVQTRDGYLWLGTGNGLVRFDGLAFVTFDVTTTPALPTNWISALHEDAEGTLWIGTDAGVVRYRDGVFTHDPLGQDLGHRLVENLFVDRAGRLWVATPRQVLRRDGDRWTRIDVGDVQVLDIALDAQGVLWVAAEGGLIQWRDRVVRTFTTRDGLRNTTVATVHVDRGGRIWMGGRRGLESLDPVTGTVQQESGVPADLLVRQLFEDRDGVLWVGGFHGLFSRTPDGRVTGHPITDEEVDVQALAQDRNGQLWVGVVGARGGLHRLSPTRVAVLAQADGLPCDNVASVTEGGDGTIWVAALCVGEDGIAEIRDGRVIRHRVAAVLATVEDGFAALLAEPEGGLWIGTFGGQLLYRKDGRITPHAAASTGLAGRQIVALHKDAQGVLWIGTDGGLSRFADGRLTTLRREQGLVDNDVRSLTIDRHGALWIGTTNGVSRYADGRFTNLTRADGLPPGAVRAIHVDAEETVWIGTYGGGLSRLKAGRIVPFGTRGGLLDSGVHRILEDESGNLWMSGDRGIRRVSRQELNDVADGRATRLTVTIYDESDGMKNAECNGMAQPAGWRMRDGSFWFATQGGVVRIQPETAPRGTISPPAAIEEVLVNGVLHDPRRAIAAPPGSTALEVRYTAPALLRPEQIQFRYRLDGYDADWVDAGTRRVAHYGNLAPRSYRFRLLARGSDGRWAEQEASLALTLQPRFHQRPIVRVAALIAAIAIAYAGIRLRGARLRQRARQLETVVAQRTTELQQEREGLTGANAQLATANEQLATANDRLSAASRTAEASHVHLLAMLDQLGIGVIVVDIQERVLFVSEATTRLVAAKEGEGLLGRSLGEILPVPPAMLADVRSALLAPRAGMRLTARLEPPAGPHYWTDIEVRVDPREAGHRVLYLCDVTETYADEPAPPADGTTAGEALVGISPAIRAVRTQIQTAASVDATVLIEGETGTGKELVARSIHETSSRRRRPFVAINCAGLTESLLASQLFGHARGAFTGAIADQVGLFEAAQGGTLLLDEIGDMPLSMQAHLLRVLQEREIVRVGESRARRIDVRVLAATHRSLDEEVSAGRFRQDLLYRIRVARIELPTLRRRPEDVPLLARGFLAEFTAAHGRPIEGIARDAMERLMARRWPGNVRELRSAIEWAVIHAKGPLIRLADLPRDAPAIGVPQPPRPAIPEVERRVLIETLERARGNRSMAARLLGVSRATLYRRLAELEAPADGPTTGDATGHATGDATGGPQPRPPSPRSFVGDPS